MGGFAWVTLATNDSYSLGALVLAHSLRQVGTAQQLAVLVTPGVTDPMREKLSQVFDVVQEVNILDSKDETNLRLLKRPELGVTFTKLHCWRLTQFEKCVFLDADTLVLENADELFDREEFSAAPDVGWPDCFNSGVFVYRPSNETYENLVRFALEKGSFDGGDQGLLNLYFSDWAHKDISKHLPFIYNMCSTACYSYIPAFKQFGANVKIVHFIGATKPWLQYFDTESRKCHPSGGLQHLQALLQKWWDIFCSLVHPSLSPEMAQSSWSHDYYDNQSSYESQQNRTEFNTVDYRDVRDPWDDYDENQGQTNTDETYGTDTTNQPPSCVETYHTEQLPPKDNSINQSIIEEKQSSTTNESHSNNEHHTYNETYSFESQNAPPSTYNPPTPVHNFNTTEFIEAPVPTENKSVHNSESNPNPHCSSYFESNPSKESDNISQTWIAPQNEPEKPSTENTLEISEPNAGLAGAFAQFTLGVARSPGQSALEDHLRRQGWEVGNIDYMGRDSFDNIWTKICETMSAAPPAKPREPSPPSVQPEQKEKSREVKGATRKSPQKEKVDPVVQQSEPPKKDPPKKSGEISSEQSTPTHEDALKPSPIQTSPQTQGDHKEGTKLPTKPAQPSAPQKEVSPACPLPQTKEACPVSDKDTAPSTKTPEVITKTSKSSDASETAKQAKPAEQKSKSEPAAPPKPAGKVEAPSKKETESPKLPPLQAKEAPAKPKASPTTPKVIEATPPTSPPISSQPSNVKPSLGVEPATPATPPPKETAAPSTQVPTPPPRKGSGTTKKPAKPKK